MAYREDYQSLGLRGSINPDGSIKIPQAMLDGAGITGGSVVEVFGNNEMIYIRTAEKNCDICGENANTTKVGNFNMCSQCIADLNSKAEPIAEEPTIEEQPTDNI